MFIAFLAAIFIGISLPAIGDVITTASGEQQVRVCVETKTNTVKYFNKKRTCPSGYKQIILNKQGLQGIQGLQGVPGSSGSSGTQLFRDCFQKREAAIAAGAILASKKDRRYFEQTTGCIVEKIADENYIAIQKAAGIPVITSWRLIEASSPNWGDGWELASVGGGLATYQVQIANFDATSALGSNYRFCIPSVFTKSNGGYFFNQSYSAVSQVEGNTFEVTVSLARTTTELIAPMMLGLRGDGGHCVIPTVSVSDNLRLFYIHEDPEQVPEEYMWPGWGWDNN